MKRIAMIAGLATILTSSLAVAQTVVPLPPEASASSQGHSDYSTLAAPGPIKGPGENGGGGG
jgi:hypothetical protein